MNDVARNLIQGGSFLDWNFTQASDFFPHMLVYLIISFFVQDASTQLMMITFFQVTTIGLIFFFIFQKLNKGKLTAFLQAIGLLILICIFQSKSGEWIFFFTTNNHFTSVSLGLFSVHLVLRVVSAKKMFSKYVLGQLFLVIFLGTASTVTFFYAVTIPMILVFVIYYRDRIRVLPLIDSFGNSFFLILIFLASSFLGLFVSQLLNPSNSFDNRLNVFEGNVHKFVIFAVDAISRNLFGSGYAVSLIAFSSMVIVFLGLILWVILGVSFLKRLDSGTEFVFLANFSLISLVSSAIFSVMSGGIVDQFFLRYFWTSLFLFAITAIALITLLVSNFGRHFFKASQFGIACIILMLTFYTFSTKPVYSEGSPFQKVAQCIVDLRTKGIDLKAGVADYWYGRSIDYLTDTKYRSYVALNTLQPFYWMTTREVLLNPDKYGNPYYNFILLHTQPDPFDFNQNKLQGFLPVFSRKFICTGTDVVVWQYENDLLHNVVQEQIQIFLK
jgi:hypothetical protein